MGFISLLAQCGLCGKQFYSNPHLVPCFPCLNGKLSPKGTKEPVCEDCFKWTNEIRVKNGLPPNTISPLAYEAAEE